MSNHRCHSFLLNIKKTISSEWSNSFYFLYNILNKSCFFGISNIFSSFSETFSQVDESLVTVASCDGNQQDPEEAKDGEKGGSYDEHGNAEADVGVLAKKEGEGEVQEDDEHDLM